MSTLFKSTETLQLTGGNEQFVRQYIAGDTQFTNLSPLDFVSNYSNSITLELSKDVSESIEFQVYENENLLLNFTDTVYTITVNDHSEVRNIIQNLRIEDSLNTFNDQIVLNVKLTNVLLEQTITKKILFWPFEFIGEGNTQPVTWLQNAINNVRDLYNINTETASDTYTMRFEIPSSVGELDINSNEPFTSGSADGVFFVEFTQAVGSLQFKELSENLQFLPFFDLSDPFTLTLKIQNNTKGYSLTDRTFDFAAGGAVTPILNGQVNREITEDTIYYFGDA